MCTWSRRGVTDCEVHVIEKRCHWLRGARDREEVSLIARCTWSRRGVTDCEVHLIEKRCHWMRCARDREEVSLILKFQKESALRKICGTNWLKNMNLAVDSRLTRFLGQIDSHEIETGSKTQFSKIHRHWNQYLTINSFNVAYCCTCIHTKNIVSLYSICEKQLHGKQQ